MKLTDEEKYEREQELLDSIREEKEKTEELKRYAGTDRNPVLYRGNNHDMLRSLTIFLIVSGIIALYVIGYTVSADVGFRVLFTALFAASLTGTAAYFSPIISLRRHIDYLDERCTFEIKGKCVRVGKTSYREARNALIIGQMYRDINDKEPLQNCEITYYDPEYIIEYKGEIIHLCERRFSSYPVSEGSERTLYIDPEAPNVFFDINRYSMEYREEKKNCDSAKGIFIKLILITGALFYFFVLRKFIS